jgi:PleD family two-component response regulator
MISNDECIVVYFADESSAHRKFVKESFKRANIAAKIFSFTDEKKLMDSLKQPGTLPDVIFLTFNLNYENALISLKRIRNKKKYAQVPVIVFSPFRYPRDMEVAFENGANLFIPKAVFIEHGERALETVFHRNWRRDIVDPDRNNFVLTDEVTTNGQLKWSHFKRE